MGEFRRSWELFKCSVQVIRTNRKLLLFPVVVMLLTCVIAAFFLLPAAMWETGHSVISLEHWKALSGHFLVMENSLPESNAPDDFMLKPQGYALLAGIYLISMFFATFFNVAFFNEIINALNGRTVSIRGGLGFAVTRLRAIFVWSLFAGIIGLIIKTLEERVGLFGKWVVRLIGLAWSVAAVFAVPVIVREEKHANPLRFLQSSSSILRRTWGESLIGFLGINFGWIPFFFWTIAVFAGGIAVGVIYDFWWLFATGLIVWLTSFVVWGYLLHVTSQVYLGALFIYATEGVVPGPFDQAQMELAWKVKSSRKSKKS